jgi:hypothetical protein
MERDGKRKYSNNRALYSEKRKKEMRAILGFNLKHYGLEGKVLSERYRVHVGVQGYA